MLEHPLVVSIVRLRSLPLTAASLRAAPFSPSKAGVLVCDSPIYAVPIALRHVCINVRMLLKTSFGFCLCHIVRDVCAPCERSGQEIFPKTLIRDGSSFVDTRARSARCVLMRRDVEVGIIASHRLPAAFARLIRPTKRARTDDDRQIDSCGW